MNEPSVVKTLTETYKIRTPHEWATIAVREWDRRADGITYQCGEIMIHSTFGNWASSWGHCGMRFKKFLVTCDFDYIFGKFMGHALRVYDGEATLKYVVERVLRDRFEGRLNQEDARYFYDAVQDRSSCFHQSLHDFVGAMHDVASQTSDPPDWMSEPWLISRDKYDPQATGFWRDIWPVFKAELAKEIDVTAPTPI